ncbi:MAG: TIGR04388 family protein, partial [Leptospira sp.]|nr:TIGR04388 family protein [Leptospira sp.]
STSAWTSILGKAWGIDPAVLSQAYGKFADNKARNKAKNNLMNGKANLLATAGHVMGEIYGKGVMNTYASLLSKTANVVGDTAHSLGLISDSTSKNIRTKSKELKNTFQGKELNASLNQGRESRAERLDNNFKGYAKIQKEAGVPGWNDENIKVLGQGLSDLDARNQAKKKKNKVTVVDIATSGFSILDKKLLGGMVMKLGTQIVRGVTTTYADIGGMAGVLSKKDVKGVYKESKSVANNISGATLNAELHQGAMNASQEIKTRTQALVFTTVGNAIAGDSGMNGEDIGKLIKFANDQKVAKQQKKEEGRQKAVTVVQVATAVAITAISAGAAGPITGPFLLASIGVVSGAAQAAIISGTGGSTNAALAGFANGVLSTVSGPAGLQGSVSWTESKPKTLFDMDGQKGGWGGGISANIVDGGGKGLGVTAGLSYTPGSGLTTNVNVSLGSDALNGRNLNSLFQGAGLGLSYNQHTGATVSVNVSSSANGRPSFNGALSYNERSGIVSVTGTASTQRTGTAQGAGTAGTQHAFDLGLTINSNNTSSIAGNYGYNSNYGPVSANLGGAGFTYNSDGTASISGRFRGGTVGSFNMGQNGRFGQFQANTNFQSEAQTARNTTQQQAEYFAGQIDLAINNAQILNHLGGDISLDPEMLFNHPELV